MLKKNLQDKHIAILAADGFEKIELTAPLKALKAAGAKVDVVSLREGRIRGVNLHKPAGKVRVQKTISDASSIDYDGLIIPGGLINPDLLRQSAEARRFVQTFDEQKKPIASLCHGPWVLASAGLLKNRTLTSWPGIRDDLVNAGATWINQEVVRDGNLLTSRGPQDMLPFINGMKELFSETLPIEGSSPDKHTSSPQADEPPQVMIGAMKWLPRPGLRSLSAVAGIAYALFRGGRHRRNFLT